MEFMGKLNFTEWILWEEERYASSSCISVKECLWVVWKSMDFMVKHPKYKTAFTV